MPNPYTIENVMIGSEMAQQFTVGSEVITIILRPDRVLVLRPAISPRWMAAKFRGRAKEVTRRHKTAGDERHQFTQEQKADIINGLETGRYKNQTEIAAKYGVSQTVVSHLVQGKITS